MESNSGNYRAINELIEKSKIVQSANIRQLISEQKQKRMLKKALSK